MQKLCLHVKPTSGRMFLTVTPGRRFIHTLLPALLILLTALSLPLLAAKPPKGPKHPPSKEGGQVQKGHTLFTKNCSPCHGANGQGGEGPNLHGLNLSESQIISTVKNGVKGEMPAFGSKFKADELKALAAFVRSLKK